MNNVKEKNMGTSDKAYCFVEQLTIFSWCWYVLPYLLKRLFSSSLRGTVVYYIDAGWGGRSLAGLMCKILGCSLMILSFRMVEIKDENRLMIRERIPFFDMMRLHEAIVNGDEFKEFYAKNNVPFFTKKFLERCIIPADWEGPFSVNKLIYLIEVVNWKISRDLDRSVVERIFFVNDRDWPKYIESHAKQYNILLRFVPSSMFKIKKLIVRSFGRELLRNWYFLIRDKGLFFALKVWCRRVFQSKRVVMEKKDSKILVEYYGHLYLDKPKFLSELFFWQQSELAGRDICVWFNINFDPLDDKKVTELESHGMTAVVSSDSANKSNRPTTHNMPFLTGSYKHVTCSSDNNWFTQRIRDYNQQYAFWRSFFDQHQIDLYVTWYKYDERHSVMGDALKNRNGAIAIYQRSYEEFSSIRTSTIADVYFAWSKLSLSVEEGSKARIPYFVQTGYLGDHRFELLKDDAKILRQDLLKAGAQQVIAFFDEASRDDERWHTAHRFMRENYIFILEKLLNEPWMGLVIKPKAPYTLRYRLGPVVDLLDKALETGRCAVISHDEFIGASNVPAVAALASDITIHAHLAAATAGIEAVLAGKPTLLLDREGWYCSSLYNLGYGKTAFDDWDALWHVCKYYLRVKKEDDIGDWSSFLSEVDPFRDGKAAMRMGTYLKWLMEGFKAGLSRDIVLADAAERYVKQWGKDKILSVG